MALIDKDGNIILSKQEFEFYEWNSKMALEEAEMMRDQAKEMYYLLKILLAEDRPAPIEPGGKVVRLPFEKGCR